MYEVYLSGSNNPIWKYKTFGSLKRRLSALAKESALSQCNVVFPIRYGFECVAINFTRTPKRWGWSAEPNGIPTKLGWGHLSTRQVNFVGRR